jgi:alpha-tubulin suppressor-like RCC1 family protein
VKISKQRLRNLKSVSFLAVALSACSSAQIRNENPATPEDQEQLSEELDSATSSFELWPKAKSITWSKTLELSVNGGTPPYQFKIQQGGGTIQPQGDHQTLFTAPEITALTVVEAQDSTGQTAQSILSINPPLAIEMKPDPATGYQFTVTGGAPPIQYSMKSDAEKSDALGNAIQDSVIVVRDAEGTTKEIKVSIDRKVPLIAFAQANSITTLQKTRVIAAGGKPPYEFSKLSGDFSIDSQTGELIPGPQGGELSVSIKDATGASTTAALVVKVVEDPVAQEVEKKANIRGLALGQGHTCSLLEGQIQCWGDNRFGQLGIGSQERQLSPHLLSGFSSPMTAVFAGALHSCAIDETGNVYCWGDNRFGQVGVPISASSSNVLQPVAVGTLGEPAITLSLGQFHSCAILASGRAACWGSNRRGQLGNGTTTHSDRPQSVRGTSGERLKQITAGAAHTCALTEKEQIYCWGFNGSGQLGEGTLADRLEPRLVQSAEKFTQVISGGFHTCGLSQNRLFCWGNSAFGQTGSGVRPSQEIPLRVQAFSENVLEASLGFYHTCTRVQDPKGNDSSSVYCWGSNQQGQVGMGSLDQKIASPQLVRGLLITPQVIASGVDHTCILGDRSTQCWGSNDLGQFGSRTYESSRAPNRPVALMLNEQKANP